MVWGSMKRRKGHHGRHKKTIDGAGETAGNEEQDMTSREKKNRIL